MTVERQQRPTLRVAMIGHAFMGEAHSQAWRTAPRAFPLPLRPEMAVLVGRDERRTQEAADRLGWGSAETDWRRVVERDDIDLVDICTPGDSHCEIAVAALEAGKHVLCEKPLANSVEEAEQMSGAATRAADRGIKAMVGFTYRRVPAVDLARRLVADGRLGDVHHVRAQYLQDWLLDPEAPLNWRLQKERAGSGALGDIGAHAIDLAQHVLGDAVVELIGMTETFVKERPLPSGAAERPLASEPGGSEETPARRGRVTVDDAAAFLGRFQGGALGVFEASRFAAGRKNALRLEVNGSAGSLSFDFEDMNLLHFHDATEPALTAGFRRILATEPDHQWVSGWWPPGHVLGYEHGFSHQVVDLVTAIADGTPIAPTFNDGLQIQRVLDAVQRSVADRRWQTVQP